MLADPPRRVSRPETAAKESVVSRDGLSPRQPRRESELELALTCPVPPEALSLDLILVRRLSLSTTHRLFHLSPRVPISCRLAFRSHIDAYPVATE